MLSPKLYSHENVARLKCVQMGFVGLTVVVCGYLAVTTAISTREIWTAEAMLRKGKTEAAELSRQAASDDRQEAKQLSASVGGIDAFAVKMSGWATARGVRLEGFVPEGSPSPTDVTSDGAKLGVWNASKVRVKGQGEFAKFMDLVDELRDPKAPIQLQSFALQSARSGGQGMINFDLVLTVYEKKSGAS